jgi:hypothetical protein
MMNKEQSIYKSKVLFFGTVSMLVTLCVAIASAAEEGRQSAQEGSGSPTPTAIHSLNNGSAGFDQRLLVQDFIVKKEKMEGLLRKQQMYEKMLTDAQRQADELERIIASEKRDMLLKKLNEISEQIKLVNQSAQTS